MVHKLNGENAPEILKHRIQCVKYVCLANVRHRQHLTENSVWKPIKGPVKDWPLALCDPRTVKLGDLEAADLVYTDYVVENRQIYHKPGQKWYYISDQRPDEAWIFRQSDSKIGAGIGTLSITKSLRSLLMPLGRCSALFVP